MPDYGAQVPTGHLNLAHMDNGHLSGEWDLGPPDDRYAHLHLINWPALWAGDEDELEDRWLLEPLIPARRQVALYAGAKASASRI